MELDKVYGEEEVTEPVTTTKEEPTIEPAVEEDEEDFSDSADYEEIDLEDSEDTPTEEPEKVVDQKKIDEIIQRRTKELIEGKNTAKKEAEKAVKELETMKALARKGLADFIEEGEEPIDAIKRMAAEAEGITVEEYEEKLEQERLIAEYKKTKEIDVIRQLKSEHLNAIKSVYTNVEVEAIEQIPNYSRYKKLMSTSQFTPLEAFEMANAKGMSTAEEEYARQKALNDSKSHIRATQTNKAPIALTPIPASSYEFWKGAYPDLSEKDLVKKYNQSKKL